VCVRERERGDAVLSKVILSFKIDSFENCLHRKKKMDTIHCTVVLLSENVRTQGGSKKNIFRPLAKQQSPLE